MKTVAILGSTGSIGRQAMEVIADHPDLFTVDVLTAFNNVELIIQQAKQFHPKAVVIANVDKKEFVQDALREEGIAVYAGPEALNEIVQRGEIDLVLTAMVGYAGLLPTVEAVKAGKDIALANKETLVVAGDLITRMAKENGVALLPVDSEHSAIFQCLAGEAPSSVEKVILTCSGGPFHGMTEEQVAVKKLKDALRHPCWSMGSKITIDSATLMNKGFEVIEAKWLFNLEPEQIEVVIHPQSIIHSMVQFRDGSIKAQLGLPDMRLPIQYAMGYPERLTNSYPRLSFSEVRSLTFDMPDTKIFRNLVLAYEALRRGGNLACILNAANEIAVESFLRKKITFPDIWKINEQMMHQVSFIQSPTLREYIDTDQETRVLARELVSKLEH